MFVYYALFRSLRALADTALVLEVDPANAKALARKRVCEQAVMAEG